MELKFTNAERKSIANGNPSQSALDKLPHYSDGSPSIIWQLIRDSLNDKSWIGSHFDNAILWGSGYISDDPYVRNTKLKTPEPVEVKIKESPNYTAATQAGSAFLGSIISSASNYASEDELLAAATKSEGNVNGISYDRYTLNRNARKYANGKLPKYNQGTSNMLNGASTGAALGGSIVPGYGHIIGAGVGAIAGGVASYFAQEAEDANWRNAYYRLGNINIANKDSASTIGMRINSRKQYGDPTTQMLYKYADGKTENIDPRTGYTKTIHATQGPDGTKLRPANAMVEPNEVAWRPRTGEVSKFSDGKSHKKHPGDIIYADLEDGDVVFTDRHENPETPGLSFAEAAPMYAKYGLLPRLELLMASAVGDKNGKNAKNGRTRMIKAAEGWLGNFVPSMLGVSASLGLMLSAYNNKPYRPNTYSNNPYETEALSTLAGLRVNPYPITQLLRAAEARANRAIDMSGGLSGGQRTLSRLAALNTTQNNIANLLSNIQQQNNAYKSSYAQAALNAGQSARQARMQANQWDLDMYARAHAARNTGIQTGIANLLSQIQQYGSNEFKRRQFNETMDLYRYDQKQRQKQLDWLNKRYSG